MNLALTIFIKMETIFTGDARFNNEGQQGRVCYFSGPYAPALLNDFKGEIENIFA